MIHTPFYSPRTLTRSYPGPDYSQDPGNRWVIVQDNTVVLSGNALPSTVLIPDVKFIEAGITRTRFLGYLGDRPCYAVELSPDFTVPPGYRLTGVRELFGTIPDEELALAAYAVRVINFDRSTRFCGWCGAETCRHPTELAKICKTCNHVTYPRLSPAIIVLVKKGEEVLLASSPRFPAGLHSVIAGFIEAHEGCEDCVHREVREEVGIEVTGIRYFGSEPWPFPDSLMLGFVADYAGGEIRIDRNEIGSAGWFGRDNLPTLPSPMSISRALIDAWVQREI